METTTTNPGPTTASLAPFLATLAASAAAVHVAFARVHFREDWRFGVFFVAVAAMQVVEAILLVRRPRPPDAPVLVAVAATSLAVVGVWVVTRTAGIPIGPETWTPEPAQAVDVACTIVEALLALGCIALLVPSWRDRAFSTACGYPAMAGTLVVISVVSASLALGGGGDSHEAHHGHPHTATTSAHAEPAEPADHGPHDGGDGTVMIPVPASLRHGFQVPASGAAGNP